MEMWRQMKGMMAYGVLVLRPYDSTITNSLAELPTGGCVASDVGGGAAWNHRSTKLCSCNVGTTG